MSDFRVVFSIEAVKALFAQIRFKPGRGSYGHDQTSICCVLGSFEHALMGGPNAREDSVRVAEMTGVPHEIVRAIESGWEGFHQNDFDDPEAYAHGAMLAKALGVEDA